MSRYLVSAMLSTLLAIPLSVSAEQHDRPCLGRVCLGEDAMSLTHLPWEQVKSPVGAAALADTRLAPKAQEWIERRFRWAGKAFDMVAPFLLLRKLDAEGIRALSGVIAVCEGFSIGDRLTAKYISTGGQETVVTFEPVAGGRDSKPRFIVSSISRFFGEVTAESLRTIKAQFADRYAGFPSYSSATQAGVRLLDSGDRGPTPTLLQPYGGQAARIADLRKNAACAANSEPR